MTRDFQGSLAVGFLLLITGLPSLTATAATGTPATLPRVTVRIYDHIGVNKGTLERGKRVAVRVFRKAGVEIFWVSCSATNTEQEPLCLRSPGANEILLHILQLSEAERHLLGHFTGGLALSLSPEGGQGFVFLFYDRVEDLARYYGLYRELALGHAMAHEIGHLLLATGHHSEQGIMRARLSKEDWEEAALGRLGFAPQEAEQLRAQVLARMQGWQ